MFQGDGPLAIAKRVSDARANQASTPTHTKRTR